MILKVINPLSSSLFAPLWLLCAVALFPLSQKARSDSQLPINERRQAGAIHLPDLILPRGVGVNIHFTRGHERDLDLIAAAGIKFIRMDFGWGGTERIKGEYRWKDYDELTENLEKRGLGAVYILDYSNELYEKSASPQHPESVAAFARWAGAAARHFQGRRIVWEIWNEPNIDFWKPKPDVSQYIALALATCKSVRESDPQATIMAPASSEFPWAFLEDMFKAGLLDSLDAVSVHPYRDYSRPPETACDDYSKLRSLIERHAPPSKKHMPIISGEWGYATHEKGVSLETQAAFIVRQQLVNLWRGVPLSIWYDWKNDGDNAAYNEHNFGTVYPDLRPKPSYEALRTMTRELSGCRIARRLEAGAESRFVLLLVNPAGDQKLAAWSVDGEQKMSLDIGLNSAEDIAIVDGQGQSLAANMRQGRLQADLSPVPQYITLKKRSLALSAAAAWQLEEPLGIRAGIHNGLAVNVSVHNPFSHAVTALAKLKGFNLSEEKSVKLTAGKKEQITLAATLIRRDSSQVPVSVTLELRDEAGALIGGATESLILRLSNPLRLVQEPMEKGCRVTIHHDGDDSLEGFLKAGDEKRPVSIPSGGKTATLQFDARRTGQDLATLPCQLWNKAGELLAESKPQVYRLLPLTHFIAKLDGDDKVAASSSIRETTSPGEDAPFGKAFALDYQFNEGWRFIRSEADKPIQLEPRPAALGLWVFGDQSGNSLRIRIRDSSGQTFQSTGPNLDWAGWRWVTYDLTNFASASHWGGADDGVARGNLSLDTALLLDSVKRKTSGRIYFTGVAAIYP
jgi:hypothetical protein